MSVTVKMSDYVILAVIYGTNNWKIKTMLAYVNIYYNPKYVVTVDLFIPRVGLLRDIAKKNCMEKIEKYE